MRAVILVQKTSLWAGLKPLLDTGILTPHLLSGAVNVRHDDKEHGKDAYTDWVAQELTLDDLFVENGRWLKWL